MKNPITKAVIVLLLLSGCALSQVTPGKKASGGTPTGPCSGDLSGTYPSCVVVSINGTAFSGANGHLVSFGAANVPADSGIAASNVALLNGTNIFTGGFTNSLNGAASASPFNLTGTCFAGTATTSTPLAYINQGVTAPTSWSTNCTEFGINAASGFLGNFIDVHVNGGGSLFKIASDGTVTMAGGQIFLPNANTSTNGVSTVGQLIFTGNRGGFSASTDGTYLSSCFGCLGASSTSAVAACETSFAVTTLATGASTTDTGLNCLPANAIIDAVVYRITTTITTAANFTIGDASTAARFCSTQSTLTAGTTGICMVPWTSATAGTMGQAAAAKVRITLNANPGAGAIRLETYYHTWTPPTS